MSSKLERRINYQILGIKGLITNNLPNEYDVNWAFFIPVVISAHQ